MFAKLSIQHLNMDIPFYKSKHYLEKRKLKKAYWYTISLFENLYQRSGNAKKRRKNESHVKMVYQENTQAASEMREIKIKAKELNTKDKALFSEITRELREYFKHHIEYKVVSDKTLWKDENRISNYKIRYKFLYMKREL